MKEIPALAPLGERVASVASRVRGSSTRHPVMRGSLGKADNVIFAQLQRVFSIFSNQLDHVVIVLARNAAGDGMIGLKDESAAFRRIELRQHRSLQLIGVPGRPSSTSMLPQKPKRWPKRCRNSTTSKPALASSGL